jgi:hypothetical protein
MTTWSRGDDLIVGISYIQNGVHVTAEPEHDEGAIHMRLQNFQWLATQGEEGLSNAAESTKDAYQALIPVLLLNAAVKANGFTGYEMAEAMHLPAEYWGAATAYFDRLGVAQH